MKRLGTLSQSLAEDLDSRADWQEDEHESTGTMEDRPNRSENRLAEILALSALVIAALATVVYLLGV
jgi:hypothetical protein